MATKLLNLGHLSKIFTLVKAYVDKAAQQVKADLIDGAPEAYDTLKEIGDYISTHESVKDGLLTQIGGKANSADVYTKTQADGKFATITSVSNKANSADVYTKTVADTTFLKAADYAQATEAEITAAASAVFDAA